MKKLISIAAVLVLLLTLTVPVFAVEINYPSVSNGEIEVTTDDGTRIVFDYMNPDRIDENDLIAAIEASGKTWGDNYTVEVYDVYEVDAQGNRIERNTPVAATCYFDNAKQLVGVFIMNADGSWSEINYSINGSHVTIYPPHLTPIAYVFQAEGDTYTGTTPSGESETDTESGTHTSPFTGDYTVIWAAAAVAMALCAGACFVSARKRNAE